MDTRIDRILEGRADDPDATIVWTAYFERHNARGRFVLRAGGQAEAEAIAERKCGDGDRLLYVLPGPRFG